MSSPKRLQSAACTNNRVWLQVWFVRLAVTFRTFCSGRGFSQTRHLKDKIRLQRWPFPLFGVHFKHLLFVVTRFMVVSHPCCFFRFFPHRGAEKRLSEGNSSVCTPRTPHDNTYVGLRFCEQPWLSSEVSTLICKSGVHSVNMIRITLVMVSEASSAYYLLVTRVKICVEDSCD